MSNDQKPTVFINYTDLVLGKLFHRCGGSLRGTVHNNGVLGSVTCTKCQEFCRWDSDGHLIEYGGDVLNLLPTLGQEGTA